MGRSTNLHNDEGREALKPNDKQAIEKPRKSGLIWHLFDIPAFTMTHFAVIVNAMVCHPVNDYTHTSNIRRTLVGNKIVDHLDVVGASPVGAAPTTSASST